MQADRVTRGIERFERRLRKLVQEITEAATTFESRWTMSALKRVDPDLAHRLNEQLDLWHRASVEGDEDDIEIQGAALVRGYRKAAECMEASGAGDDAYFVGRCSKTGVVLAIGHQKAAAERAGETGAVWISPDEVAELLGGVEGLRALLAVKRAWPGSEVVRVEG
ncbi:MAG TPA: hypothetical protein VHL98_11005 [Microvirga sp.]|jgi:hypothetical protein|nr:hypothetical protein [Microvirga sp.]